MKKSTTKGHSTFNAEAVNSLPQIEAHFTIVGITDARYMDESIKQEAYETITRKVRRVEGRNPYDLSLLRLKERALKALWALEDAQDSWEELMESLQNLAAEGHNVEEDLSIFKTSSPKEVANSLIEGIIDSIIEGVRALELPWKDEGCIKGAETMLQRAISKAYGRIKASKLDKDVKGSILAGLSAYKGGGARRRLNKAYKSLK